MGTWSNLGEALLAAVTEVGPDGFLVQVVNHRSDRTSRGMTGRIPVVVIGHKELGKEAWRTWAYEATLADFGHGAAERASEEGLDLRDLIPSGVIGRRFRQSQREDVRRLFELEELLKVVESWPEAYTAVAFELRDAEPMTVAEMMERLGRLPNPRATTDRQYMTLGDLISRNVGVLPSY